MFLKSSCLLISLAFAAAEVIETIISAASIPIIATTISNSIKVKELMVLVTLSLSLSLSLLVRVE
jgi:hypothetical protein